MNNLINWIDIPKDIGKIRISTATACHQTRNSWTEDMLFLGSEISNTFHWSSNKITVNGKTVNYWLYRLDSFVPTCCKYTVSKKATDKVLRIDCAFWKKWDKVDIPKELMEVLWVPEDRIYECKYEYFIDKEIEWVVWYPDKKAGIL